MSIRIGVEKNTLGKAVYFYSTWKEQQRIGSHGKNDFKKTNNQTGPTGKPICDLMGLQALVQPTTPEGRPWIHPVWASPASA